MSGPRKAWAYVDYHAALLRPPSCRPCRNWLASPTGRSRSCDAGPNIETALLRAPSDPGVIVDTLGFADPAVPPSGHQRHIEFDQILNQATERSRVARDGSGGTDVIVMAEALEHLHVPPHAVLEFLAARIRRPGSRHPPDLPTRPPCTSAWRSCVVATRGGSAPDLPGESWPPPRVHPERAVRDQVNAGGLTIDWLLRRELLRQREPGRIWTRAVGRLVPATWRHGSRTVCARAGR